MSKTFNRAAGIRFANLQIESKGSVWMHWRRHHNIDVLNSFANDIFIAQIQPAANHPPATAERVGEDTRAHKETGCQFVIEKLTQL